MREASGLQQKSLFNPMDITQVSRSSIRIVYKWLLFQDRRHSKQLPQNICDNPAFILVSALLDGCQPSCWWLPRSFFQRSWLFMKLLKHKPGMCSGWVKELATRKRSSSKSCFGMTTWCICSAFGMCAERVVLHSPMCGWKSVPCVPGSGLPRIFTLCR